ncbi:hypothetical protein C8Q76DRAFT_797422 [Earliella scabrosa]|nr:hypothetical protein C8Q76DRAFT_797422 [Earliella scabrosa]
MVASSPDFFPGDTPSLDNTYGAILLGSNFGLILYGFNLHQAIRYFRQFPNDSRFVKGLVCLVLILETVNMAFAMHISYAHLVTNYFNPIELTYASWALDVMPLAAGLSMMTTQCFFIRRVFLLGGSRRIVAYIAMALVVVEFAFTMGAYYVTEGDIAKTDMDIREAGTIEAFIQPSFEAYASVTWLVSVALGVIILTDALLTISLIIALRTSRTGFKRTDSLIDVLVLYAITTGLLTTLMNCVAFFLSLLLPDNLIYVGVNTVVIKLYVTSLFAALHSRIALAKYGSTTVVYGTGGTVIPTQSTTAPEHVWRVAPRVRL